MTDGSELDRNAAFPGVVALVRTLCALSGSTGLIEDARSGMAAIGVVEAVQRHDNAVLFDWLMTEFSYQGIGDSVATSYMEAHGRIAADDILHGLDSGPSCPKLAGYWTFEDCRFHKGSKTCAEPEHHADCPLPRHDLRNGRLNQTAYSLFLFFRDVAAADFVSWVDRQLETAKGDQCASQLVGALVEPLGHIYGVSNKVVSMALATLLLGGDDNRPLWIQTGAHMIAIDTLVHNWLHRTGILHRLDCDHPYGQRCYGENGCAAIITAISAQIDGREFNSKYPANFPRFVQKAIWTFCAQSGLNECNGNRIDDRFPCESSECALSGQCDHRALR